MSGVDGNGIFLCCVSICTGRMQLRPLIGGIKTELAEVDSAVEDLLIPHDGLLAVVLKTTTYGVAETQLRNVTNELLGRTPGYDTCLTPFFADVSSYYPAAVGFARPVVVIHRA